MTPTKAMPPGVRPGFGGLIPFGLRVAGGVLVDVADVSKGNRSGCICPSCETPLVARHGGERIWPFAHRSHQVYGRTREKCEYSFWVAVRMMARQIVGDKLEMKLPECRGEVEAIDAITGLIAFKEFLAAREQKISISNIAVERIFNRKPVDIIGDVDGTPFIIYFTHPGRKIPAELFEPQESRCGVVAISFEPLPASFEKAREVGQTYQTVLSDYLAHHIESKKWIFHPRYERLRAEAQEAAEAEIRERRQQAASHIGPKTLNVPIPQLRRTGLAEFECVMCGVFWKSQCRGDRECPKCGSSHLYHRFIRYV